MLDTKLTVSTQEEMLTLTCQNGRYGPLPSASSLLLISPVDQILGDILSHHPGYQDFPVETVATSDCQVLLLSLSGQTHFPCFHILQIGYIHLRTVYQGIFFPRIWVSSVTSGSQRIFVASAWTRKSDPRISKLGMVTKGTPALRQGRAM
jgi:hypothetical protein